MDSPPIRVLIVDDDALVRAGLSMMLAGAGDLEVVGDVADGAGMGLDDLVFMFPEAK